MKKIKAAIAGGAGYTGGEMIRLLLEHPGVELTEIQSRSFAGKPLYEIHQDLLGNTNLHFSDSITAEADVLFLCLGHGESANYIRENSIPEETRIIDLSEDFRLEDGNSQRKFVYGLPEFQREKIREAQNIANPGCFATTILLGLLPLAFHKSLDEVFTTGITGSTGAGQRLQETTHFTWRTNNISPYKTLTHQHLGEIRKTLGNLHGGHEVKVNFVPWRGDFTRGIFVTSVLKCEMELENIRSLYNEYYVSHPFTHISENMIDLKQVVNTNKCFIHLEKEGNHLVIHSTLDNLLKGASGQALQNMNLMMGFDEREGLNLKGSIY